MKQIAIRHWLPIVTVCPVNSLPDLIYATVTFEIEDNVDPPELYSVRRRVRQLLSWRKCFMESLADYLFIAFPEAHQVEIRLAFNRHVVIARKF